MAKESLFEKLQLDSEKFLPLVKKLQSSYQDLTYHNKTHAADLSQTFYYFLTTGNLRQKCELDDLEVFSYLMAASCHDLDHPGFNNIYMIEKRDMIAVRYNDVSVLENHHVASSFAILSEPQYNVTKSFPKD